MVSNILVGFMIVLGTQIIGSIGDDHAIATSACIGLSSTRRYTAAIPRDCHGGKSCKDICSSVKTMDETNGGYGAPQCFNALHIYPGNRGPKNTANTKWINTWIYGGNDGCTKTHCGPNFCCCLL
uniref:Secreted protein n=1 Tax=Magallana gigas TaxID=29159 RepID=A0A8W8P031_MAGGI|nr:uncharacterized protein LOC117688208 [Crassostrea gigas]